MAYRFLIKDVAPQRLVMRRARASALDWGDALSSLFARVWEHLNRDYESVTVGPPMARLRPIDSTSLEIEAGFPVIESIDPPGEFAVGELAAGRAATTLHEGPYERLVEAFAALDRWMEAERLEPLEAPWMVFWATPDDVDHPSDLRTELVCPIRAFPQRSDDAA